MSDHAYTDEMELSEGQRATVCELLGYHPREARNMWVDPDSRSVYCGSDFVGYHRQGYLLIDQLGSEHRGIAIDQYGSTRRIRHYA